MTTVINESVQPGLWNGSTQPGLCACGCGEPTRRAPYSSKRVGWIKGQWTQYVLGHNKKTTPRYAIDPDTGCWTTLGGTTPVGYGKITEGRRTHLLHRWMYERVVGPIPEGKQLHHVCRNKGCCNPAHMRVVTLKEHRAIDTVRLADDEVRAIVLLAVTKTMTRARIAERFGVHESYVGMLVRGEYRGD